MDARGVIPPLRFSLLVNEKRLANIILFCGRAASATNTLDFDQLRIKWNHQNYQNDLRKHVKKKRIPNTLSRGNGSRIFADFFVFSIANFLKPQITFSGSMHVAIKLISVSPFFLSLL